MKTQTLRELGPNLPIPVKLTNLGITLPKSSFAFRPWRMAEEKKAGEIRQRYKHPSIFLRELLDFMLVELGGRDWATWEEDKRKLVMAMLPYGDVFYLYLSLRVWALGEEFKFLPCKCPRCDADLEGIVADLGLVEVKTVEEKDPEQLEYKLKSPIRVGEIEIESLLFVRTPWDTMTQLPAADLENPGALKEAFMTSSLAGAKAKDTAQIVQLDKSKVLGELSKRDIEYAHKAISEFNGGPDLTREVECNKCGHKWGAVLDWVYDHFFGTSSL